MSLRDRIRSHDDRPGDTIDVPEWDQKVLVRSLSLADADRILTLEGDITLDLVIAGCFDPDTGEALFGDDDRGWLPTKAATALRRLSNAVIDASSLREKAVDEAGKGS